MPANSPPCGTWTTTDVPQASVGMVMAQYRADGAKKVEKTAQPNGKWTVTATFDPCPPGQPQSTTKQHG